MLHRFALVSFLLFCVHELRDIYEERSQLLAESEAARPQLREDCQYFRDSAYAAHGQVAAYRMAEDAEYEPSERE